MRCANVFTSCSGTCVSRAISQTSTLNPSHFPDAALPTSASSRRTPLPSVKSKPGLRPAQLIAAPHAHLPLQCCKCYTPGDEQASGNCRCCLRDPVHCRCPHRSHPRSSALRAPCAAVANVALLNVFSCLPFCHLFMHHGFPLRSPRVGHTASARALPH
jgi:hypothetical protein